jgi:hypothetical protein
MKNTSFEMTENGIQMMCQIGINYCNKQKHGSDFDIDAARQRSKGYALDLIGAYSPILIASLERRMRACEENLIRHLNDIEYADNCGHIMYIRKDRTRGGFNVPSFNAMKDCVKALSQSQFKSVFENKCWIDQILKALLNDTEQHHEDKGPFKYSELISLLCELQACPLEYMASRLEPEI